MSDELPHDELSRQLDRAWHQQRRALLLRYGIVVRRPQHAVPADEPEKAATCDDWARAVVDVAAVQAFGVENVTLDQLEAIVDDYLARLSAEEALPLLELSREVLLAELPLALMRQLDVAPG